MNFFELIYPQLLRYADEVLIRWPNNSQSTGKSLLDLIAKFQTQLPNNNESILIAQAFNEDALAIILACIANGNPVLVYPKNFNSQQLKNCFRENDIKYAFAKKFLVRVYLRFFSIKLLAKQLNKIANIQIKQVDGEFIALKSFSSGSTGLFKQINRSHTLLSEQVKAIDSSFHTLHQKIDFPLFANILLYNLSVGKKTVIPDIKNFDLQQLDVKKITTQLKQENIASLTGNQYYFETLCHYLYSKNIKLKNIEYIGIGGSPISNRLIDKLKKCFPKSNIQIIYGSTEAEPISIKVCKEEVSPAYYGFNVGKVHPFIELKINAEVELSIDDYKVPSGQILVRGKHVATKQDGGFLSTGDYGFMLNDELFLSAREGNTQVLHDTQHLQLEHCLEHNLGIQVSIIINKNTLHIYSERNLNAKEIEKILFVNYGKIFPIKLIKKRLPKDPRHLSKILYYRLNEV